jgi:predicted transcriptional regulator
LSQEIVDYIVHNEYLVFEELTMSTVTARIPEETAAKLNALAKATNRSKSFIVANALDQFLEEQAWQVARINESIAQADAGNFASNAEVKGAFAKWGLNVDAD